MRTGPRFNAVLRIVRDQNLAAEEFFGDGDLRRPRAKIRENQQPLPFVLANVRVYVGVIHGVRFVRAAGDDRAFLAEGDEAPIVRENSARRLFLLDVDSILTGGTQPGRPGSEPGAFARIPLHGSSGIVTRFPADNRECLLFAAAGLDELGVRVVRLDIDVIRYLGVAGIGHADFLAHVDERRSPQEVDDGREHGRGLDAVASRITESVDGARLVVVVPEQRVPTFPFLHAHGPFVEDALERTHVERHGRPLLAVLVIDFEMVEAENHVEFAVARIRVADARLDARGGHLAHRYRVGVAPEAGFVELAKVGVNVRAVRVHLPIVASRGRVEKLCVFPDDVDDVEAETVHAATAPKVDDVDELGPHLRIVPVQIGLGEIVKVKVVITGVAKGRPRRSAELGDPIGWKGAVGLRRANVVVILVLFFTGQSALKPLVVRGRVIENHVEHHAYAVASQGADKLVEVLHRSHRRVDVAVVRDVVAVVALRRREERTEPDVVDPQ